jgi:hypothetical protein
MMNFGPEPVVQQVSVVAKRWRSPSGARWVDHLPGEGFPYPPTQVAVISVDTAGREVPLPGQKGICVQWR